VTAQYPHKNGTKTKSPSKSFSIHWPTADRTNSSHTDSELPSLLQHSQGSLTHNGERGASKSFLSHCLAWILISIYSPAGQQGLGQSRPQGETRVALIITVIQDIRTLIQTFFAFVLIITSLPLFMITSLPLFTISFSLFTISLSLFPFLLFHQAMKLLESIIIIILNHFDPSQGSFLV